MKFCTCPKPIRGNRYPDICRSCSFKIAENPLSDEIVADFFDHLRETLEAAGKIHRPQPGEADDPRFEWFEKRAKQRLAQGAKTYGNRNFLRESVDLIEEGTQECLDLANYALMELQKTQPDSCAGVPLGMAAYYSFLAALSLLDYRDKLRGSF